MERMIQKVTPPARKKAPKLKRVAAYARVSSGREAPLHSLSAQAPDTLNNLKQPINNPQSPAREYPIKYHRPRDGKDLTPNPEDLPFFFIFNSR